METFQLKNIRKADSSKSYSIDDRLSNLQFINILSISKSVFQTISTPIYVFICLFQADKSHYIQK